jgi:catechol 2,3-dioxygenase-like lactoylglutathione lyase family enzyme
VRISTVTVTVASLERSRRFYEDVLGFEVGPDHPATTWQSYRLGDQLFGLRELPGFVRRDAHDITNVLVDDLDALWERVRDRATVIESPAPTDWGSFRFVVADPDGYQLAFVAASG